MIFGGSVDCWGDGYSGELGNGTWGAGAGSDIPVAVSGITGATQLSAGSQHACVLLPDHSIECWGDNSDGQLGNGKFGVSNVPVTVSGAATTTQVSAGDDHTCAVHSDGSALVLGPQPGRPARRRDDDEQPGPSAGQGAVRRFDARSRTSSR